MILKQAVYQTDSRNPLRPVRSLESLCWIFLQEFLKENDDRLRNIRRPGKCALPAALILALYRVRPRVLQTNVVFIEFVRGLPAFAPCYILQIDLEGQSVRVAEKNERLSLIRYGLSRAKRLRRFKRGGNARLARFLCSAVDGRDARPTLLLLRLPTKLSV
jgi:hypothetical protein